MSFGQLRPHVPLSRRRVLPENTIDPALTSDRPNPSAVAVAATGPLPYYEVRTLAGAQLQGVCRGKGG